MTGVERAEVAWSVAKLRAAEAVLAQGVACGDTQNACVEALALIRAALGPNPPPSEPHAQREAA